jgi:hypothetical protein
VRCYFLRNNRIEAVELLQPGPDKELIEQAASLFVARGDQYDGFEVWDARRFVYRSQTTTVADLGSKWAAADGTSGRGGPSLSRSHRNR